jgi:hypothetical protein
MDTITTLTDVIIAAITSMVSLLYRCIKDLFPGGGGFLLVLILIGIFISIMSSFRRRRYDYYETGSYVSVNEPVAYTQEVYYR